MARGRFNLGWGMRRDRKALRGSGGGGAGVDVTAPYRALLGSSLVALWDARVGVQLIGGEVNGWTDQIGGVVLTAPDSATRPTYAPDGTNLRARNVIGIANASNKRLGNIATPPVLGVGANPALFMVGRLTSVVAGNRWFVRVYDAPLSNAQFGLLMQFGTNMTCEFAGESLSPAFADAASAHVFEQLYGSVHTVAIDGATIATGASGALLSPTGRIGVGGNGSGTAGTVQDMAVAMVGIINPAPSAATRSQLLALINSDWGTPVPALPPLPASAVEFWHSEMQCTPTAWVGQMRGLSLAGQNTPTVAVDPGFFNGRVVAQTTLSGLKCWASTSLLPPLVDPGSFPWVIVIARYRAPAINHVVLGFGDSATLGTVKRLQLTATNTHAFYDSAVYAQLGGANTSPARLKAWNDGTNANLSFGNTTTSTPSTVTQATAANSLSIGSLHSGSPYAGDCNVAFVCFCSSKPTPAEEAALDAWVQAYWGVP